MEKSNITLEIQGDTSCGFQIVIKGFKIEDMSKLQKVCEFLEIKENELSSVIIDNGLRIRLREIFLSCKDNSKLMAVKEMKDVLKLGLKEAKDLCDTLLFPNISLFQEDTPETFIRFWVYSMSSSPYWDIFSMAFSEREIYSHRGSKVAKNVGIL